MTVFGCVTATISPTLSSYIRYKGKVWKTAFITSLQTIAGVEYTVYKKKGCLQIKGDWEKIKHAHRILTKVTTVDDWSGHVKREAVLQKSRAESLKCTSSGKQNLNTNQPSPSLELEERDDEFEDEDVKSIPSYAHSGENESDQKAISGISDVHSNSEWDIKTEDVDDRHKDTIISSETTGAIPNPNIISQLGPPSPVHLPTTCTENFTITVKREPKTSGSRRKKVFPRKAEAIYNESTDEEIDLSIDDGFREKTTKLDDNNINEFQNFSDYNDDLDSVVSDDPDFSIDKMVQEGKKNLQTRRSEKSFACDHCEFLCKYKSGMFEHNQRHHHVKELTCPICNKAYGVRRDLRKHIKRHTSQFKCDKCGKTYKEERNFKQHLQTHEHGYIPSYFACEQCEKRFTTKYVLMSHVEQIHRGIIPEWLCTTCGKKFKQKHSLAEHTLIHTGERPYSCKICNKTFRHKGSCISHELLHSNVRMYTCEVCGKDFKHRNSLRSHASVHTNERQYTCTVCDKKFTQKQALTRHMRIHSGEKPFKCELCDDRFSDKSVLRRHMMGVHKLAHKPDNKHYVLPAEHYDGTKQTQTETAGVEDRISEQDINLDISDNAQDNVPPNIPHQQQSLLAIPNSSTLQNYHHISSSQHIPTYMSTETVNSFIGGTGMLLPVVPASTMSQY